MRRIIIGLLALAVVAFMAWKLYGNKKEINHAAAFKEKIENIQVDVIEAKKVPLGEEKRYLGVLSPFREVELGSETVGKIVEQYVEEGDRVQKGQLLAKVDDELLKIKLTTEEAQLEKAATDMARFENLSKEEATSDMTLKQMQLAHKVAESQVKSTRDQIEKTNIKAPFSGVLTSKTFEAGTVISRDAKLGTISDVSSLKMSVMIPENEINLLKIGQKVAIFSDAVPNQTFTGEITLISVKADDSHNYKVEATVTQADKSGLKAGMYASLAVSISYADEGILIPRSALVGSVKSPQVFRVVDGKAALGNVSIAETFGDQIRISQGLNEGDWVVTSGQVNLSDGISVQANKK